MAINTPKIIKNEIATIDLLLSLGSPQTPCPLVHPFAIFDPKPTKNPAKMNPRRDRSPTNFEVVSKYVGEFNSFGLDKGSKKHFIKEEIWD